MSFFHDYDTPGSLKNLYAEYAAITFGANFASFIPTCAAFAVPPNTGIADNPVRATFVPRFSRVVLKGTDLSDRSAARSIPVDAPDVATDAKFPPTKAVTAEAISMPMAPSLVTSEAVRPFPSNTCLLPACIV